MGLFRKNRTKKQRRSLATRNRLRRNIRVEPLEDRRLLASVQLTGTGDLQYNGDAQVDQVTVSYNSGTGEYTFADPARTITAGANITDLDPGNPNQVRFNAVAAEASAGSVITRVNVNTLAGAGETVTINSIRSGSERLNVSANLSPDAVTVGGNLGSAGSRLGGTVVLQGTSISLGGDIFTNSHAVNLAAPITLTASATVDTIDDNITAAGAIDGGFGLTLVGGFLDLDQGAIGGGTPLSSFTSTGDNTQTSAITTTGSVSVTSDVYSPQGAIAGTGTASIVTRTAGSDLSLVFGSVANPITNDFSGFTQVNLGDINTGTLTIRNDGIDGFATAAGNLDVNAALTLTGDSVAVGESINNGTNLVTINADTALDFGGQGSLTGTGDTVINKINAGGTLTIVGIGGKNFGAADTTVNAAGSTVVFDGQVGGNLGSLDVTASTITHNHFTSISALGDVTLTATTINLGGGIFGGTVEVNGDLVLSRDSTILVGSGEDLTVTGTTTANGRRITIRGSGGPIDEITLGNVNGASQFQIDSGGGNTAATVNLTGVTADNIVVRGVAITTNGTIAATNGSVHLLGNVTLAGDTSLLNSSGNARKFVRVDGTINGAFGLTIDSGNGATALSQAVGSGIALASMTVNSGGKSTIGSTIDVSGDFSWTACGGGQNQLLVVAQITVGGNSTLQAAILDIRVAPLVTGTDTQLSTCP